VFACVPSATLLMFLQWLELFQYFRKNIIKVQAVGYIHICMQYLKMITKVLSSFM